jgi:hypothetical protein
MHLFKPDHTLTQEETLFNVVLYAISLKQTQDI